MSTTKTYDDCKKQVAEKHGYRLGAIESIEKSRPTLFAVINEAAELYAQRKANEAVKEDRATIRTTCLESMPKLDKSGDIEGYYWIFDGSKFERLPLPFSESL